MTWQSAYQYAFASSTSASLHSEDTAHLRDLWTVRPTLTDGSGPVKGRAARRAAQPITPVVSARHRARSHGRGAVRRLAPRVGSTTVSGLRHVRRRTLRPRAVRSAGRRRAPNE